jgi:hypothetical protein
LKFCEILFFVDQIPDLFINSFFLDRGAPKTCQEANNSRDDKKAGMSTTEDSETPQMLERPPEETSAGTPEAKQQQ